MYQNVSQLTFINKFTTMGRKSQFSYSALVALFEYYEGLEESTGEPIELDVIGICCDWTEYKSTQEFFSDYPHYVEDDYSPEETAIMTIGDVFALAGDHCTVLDLGDAGLLVSN